jgi:aspartyl-tRNA(Asn)/glutamyl-tRNA(Gln) amidotransferase subunit A
VLAGPDARDPFSARFAAAAPCPARPRLGWLTRIGEEGATPEVTAAIAEAAERFAVLGCEVVPVAAPYDLALLRAIWGTLTAAGAARVARQFPDRWRAETTDSIRATVERGLALPATAYVEALDKLAVFRAGVTAHWGDYDALLLPTGAAPAWKAEDEAPPGLTAATQGMFCGWVNAAGMPGLSIPATPHPDGRPIGLQLVAPFGGDALLLNLACRYEAAAPWADRWPALALEA